MTKEIFVQVILGKEELFQQFLFFVIEQGEPLLANMLLESLSFTAGIPVALEFLLNQAILREDSPAVARFKNGEMATMESLFRSFQTILQRYRPQSHTPEENAL